MMDEKITRINNILTRLYPAECSLEFAGEGWRLLVMTRLSAQCTDARVNKVCEVLFAEFPTLEALAGAPIEEIERIVYPCGFYRTKARNIKDTCGILVEKYGGRIPDTMEELLELPGVGRKTANLVLAEVYGYAGVVTDTHCIRLSNRLGLSASRNPAVVEKDLRARLDPAISSDFCHRLVFHGRAVCTARKPNCGECELRGECEFYRSL